MGTESLDKLSKKYCLDKNISSGCHNYIPGYAQLFDGIREKTRTVLEIGIGSVENGQMSGVVPYGYKTGNSLKCWSEYFSNAHIYGIDIYQHKELDTERIHTIVADQSNQKDLKMIIDKIGTTVNVIIDDGSHDPNHQVFSFMYLYRYLSSNGIYVIEDINPEYIDAFRSLSVFPTEFADFIRSNFEVTCFDTRDTIGRADDFMISFTRRT